MRVTALPQWECCYSVCVKQSPLLWLLAARRQAVYSGWRLFSRQYVFLKGATAMVSIYIYMKYCYPGSEKSERSGCLTTVTQWRHNPVDSFHACAAGIQTSAIIHQLSVREQSFYYSQWDISQQTVGSSKVTKENGENRLEMTSQFIKIIWNVHSQSDKHFPSIYYTHIYIIK